jgi:SAM-dependent methyltransferase
VACGTGVLARAVAERVGPGGAVVGVDVNEGMLAVARRKAPRIDWRHGRAEALPLDSDSFDAVVSQFGLMFFEDRHAALQEMVRVLKSGGRLAVAAWDSIEQAPGFASLARLLGALFDDQVADALRAPFALGDRQRLRTLLQEAGLASAQIETQRGTARFPSVASFVHTEIRGWTLADRLDDDQFDRLLREAERALQSFVTADGAVAFDVSAHIVTMIKA